MIKYDDATMPDSVLRGINAAIHERDREIAAAYKLLNDFAHRHGIVYAPRANIQRLSPFAMKRYHILIERFDSLVQAKADLNNQAKRMESLALLESYHLKEGDTVYYPALQYRATITVDMKGYILLTPYGGELFIYPFTIGKRVLDTLLVIDIDGNILQPAKGAPEVSME